MKWIQRSLLVVMAALLWVACNSDASKKSAFNKEYDLMSYAIEGTPVGIPLKIKGPEDLQINKRKSLLEHELSLKGSNFDVYLYGQAAATTDRKAIKQREIDELMAGAGFKAAVVEEEDFGFIFSKVYEGDSVPYYDFKYMVVKGDMEFKFNSTTVTAYTLEQIKAMYKAVKQE